MAASAILRGARGVIAPASAVVPLHTPTQFFTALLRYAEASSRQISLASLYLGTGSQEQELVQTLLRRCRETAHAAAPLQVGVQLDYSRSLRRVHSKSAPDLGPGDYDSSAHLLLELLRGAPTQARVGLTRMPQLRGLVGRLLPPRWVEGAGVFHLKAYAFDDTVVLSGANLSHDYFTNRQDRYVVVEDVPAFADGVHALVGGLRGLPGSHVLGADGRVTRNGCAAAAPDALKEAGQGQDAACVHGGGAGGDGGSTCDVALAFDARRLPPVTTAADDDDGGSAAAAANAAFSAALRELSVRYSVPRGVEPGVYPGLLARHHDAASDGAGKSGGLAVLRPRMQLGALGCTLDEDATVQLLQGVGPAPTTAGGDGSNGSPLSGDVLHVASGYFNLTQRYQRTLLQDTHRQASIHVLTAAPRANGFYGARGMSGAIPLAYSMIEERFYRAVALAGRLPRPRSRPPRPAASASGGDGGIASTSSPAPAPGVSIYEYDRAGWTFHGKGLWLARYHDDRGGGGRDAAAAPPAASQPPPLPPRPSSMVTLVGSPNFGVRSVTRDLEMQVEIGTSDGHLIDRLCRERDALWGHADAVTAAATAAPALQRVAVPVDAAGSGAASVREVGPHLGPEADVWRQRDRQPHKLLDWSHGLWVHLGWRVFSPFF